MIKVLFVCMGNICRSPTAQGLFKQQVSQVGLSHLIEIDSAGTHDYRLGEPPDLRAQMTARKRGYDISQHLSRQIEPADFSKFDYVLAMDRNNYDVLHDLCPATMTHKIHMLLAFAPQLGRQDIPDPYCEGLSGFELVLDLIETANRGLLTHLQQQLAASGHDT